jgi:hypothetical protein
VLAEHDDEVYADRRDPLLAYSLPHDGEFYIKVRAWKHPSAGDSDLEYTIRLYEDYANPLAYILIPQSNSYIPLEPFDVTAQINDVVDGISHVDFFWHDYDWIIPTWELLETDWDSSDGWAVTFDPTGLLERDGGSIHLDAYDKAGNLAVAGVWNIGVDLTAPSTDLVPLEAEQESSALKLIWDGSDNASGLSYSNLQFKLDGGAWQSYPDEIHSRETWFIGNPGHEYEFRIRGVDRAGNIEDYPANAQAVSTIPAAGVLCSSPDLYDAGDGDNTTTQASSIDPKGGIQVHNFCNPRAPDLYNDEDWIKFPAQSGIRYLIQALPLSGNVGTVLELYAEDGTTLIERVDSPSFGHLARLAWNSDRSGQVFLRVRHLDGRVIGNIVAYTVSIDQGYSLYFPLLSR